jgi:hypothetical protein
MPNGLLRFQWHGHLYFVTFSSHLSPPYFDCACSRQCFEEKLDWARKRYGFVVIAVGPLPRNFYRETFLLDPMNPSAI